jgi:rhamnogalacturonyl hydrolase YesR
VTVLAMITALTILQPDFKPQGLEAMAALKREFAVSGIPGYAEATVDGKPNGVLFNWGVGVLMSAMNAAARHDPEWKKELRRFVEATRSYWNPVGPTPGYDVLPVPKDADRYYDDNAWMVMALVEASEVLDDPKPLEYARQALAFVLSGEDDHLGGGIYWREKEKKSKNTCSNGPTVAACLAVYEKTKDAKLLESAKRIYAWTKNNLQDPSDGLMWDSLSLDGNRDETKWSYNTALMVRSAAELARITGENQYLEDAERMAKASEVRWLVDGRLADYGRFAHLLLESWHYVPGDRRKSRALSALKWLCEHGKNEKGLFGPRFDAPPKPEQSRFELIDQASAARALLDSPG